MRIPRSRAELRRHGPNLFEAAVRTRAEAVQADLVEQRNKWAKGFTRRKVIAGAGMVGCAALSSQLMTTRYAFGAPSTTNRTLIIVTLFGGMDGLSVVVPAGDPNLLGARRNIGIPAGALLPAGRTFGLHPQLAPLRPFWNRGQMAAVHAVGVDETRSHFVSADTLARGAASGKTYTGWMDRALAAFGPGTTFRGVAMGDAIPRSFVGPQDKIIMSGLEDFTVRGTGTMRNQTLQALASLYTGLDHPLATQAKATLNAVAAVQKIGTAPPAPRAPAPAPSSSGSPAAMAPPTYPGGSLSNGLRDMAYMIKAGVGLRMGTIELGGWDTHTGQGAVTGGAFANHLRDLVAPLAAFATDLGPALDNVTLLTISEFGRRRDENGNGGTDHGSGGVVLALGGGLNGGQVHGRWPGLAPGALDNGDLAGVNDYRDIFGEALAARFGVADLGPVFPDHKYTRLGVFR